MQVIGIDLDGDYIHFAIINKKKDLIDVQTVSISDLSDVKLLYKCRNPRAEKILTATGLDAQDVLIKSTLIKLKKKRAIKKAFNLKQESLTSISSDKTLSIPVYFQEKSLLKFFITTKAFLLKHLKRLTHFKIDPDHISSASIALCRFTCSIYKDTTAFLVHIGTCKTTCILMQESVPLRSQTIKIGSKKLYQALNEDKINGNIDFLKLSDKNQPKFKNVIEQLKTEIDKTFQYFTKKQETTKYPLLVTGDIQDFENIDVYFAKALTSLSIAHCPLEKDFIALKKYALCIGFALDLLAADTNSLQFRKNEFTSKREIRKIGIQAFCFILFCFSFSICAFFFSNSLFKNKQRVLQSNFIKLQNFDSHELQTKYRLKDDKNIYVNLDYFEDRINKEARNFPFFLKAPRVSEVLNWLNSHPTLLKSSKINSLKYDLEKYPTLGANKEPYVAKIELEFTTQKSKDAREFHDSLLKGIGLVNPSSEITWDVNQDNYKTTFYLKNLTP